MCLVLFSNIRFLPLTTPSTRRSLGGRRVIRQERSNEPLRRPIRGQPAAFVPRGRRETAPPAAAAAAAGSLLAYSAAEPPTPPQLHWREARKRGLLVYTRCGLAKMAGSVVVVLMCLPLPACRRRRRPLSHLPRGIRS